MNNTNNGSGVMRRGEPEQGTFDIKEVLALRELREAVGMDCENVPLDVREALHRVPGIEKSHSWPTQRVDRNEPSIARVYRPGL